MDGVSTTESELDLKSENPIKSLTGKDLPNDWPKITLDTEYRHKFDGFRHGIDLTIERFSYKLDQGSKHLNYLAVEHTDNPQNPQFKALEDSFNQFQPDFILYEGPDSRGKISDRERAISHGEKSFLIFLAQRENIPSESADIQDPEWVSEFRKLGHSNEEIAVFDILRKTYYLGQDIKNNTSLSKNEKTQHLNEKNVKLTSDFNGLMAEIGFPELFSLLPREDGKPWDTDTIKEAVETQVGQPLDINLNARDFPKFKQMFEEEAIFRDQYQVKRITETVKNHDRVMVVMGSAHPLRQEASLREFFDNPK